MCIEHLHHARYWVRKGTLMSKSRCHHLTELAVINELILPMKIWKQTEIWILKQRNVVLWMHLPMAMIRLWGYSSQGSEERVGITQMKKWSSWGENYAKRKQQLQRPSGGKGVESLKNWKQDSVFRAQRTRGWDEVGEVDKAKNG